MPRVTKAQLEARVARLDAENEGLERRNEALDKQNREVLKENYKLKDHVRRGNSRSRSPRRPATSAEANVALTCRALRQVSLWQQAPVVQERSSDYERSWPRRTSRSPASAGEKGPLDQSCTRSEGAKIPSTTLKGILACSNVTKDRSSP